MIDPGAQQELMGRYTGQAERLYRFLMQYNGRPTGIFTGDECLSGRSPIQGTELCGVVELMYSFEQLFAATGEEKWLELLERLALNALPATCSDDMWAHQYLQMSNQISAEKFPGRSLFRTNGPAAHIFGLEPNFGCCTANFSQGFPKFALSSFAHADGVILSAVPVPGTLRTDTVTVTLETDYPFRNRFLYRIAAKEPFTFRVRIPSFASHIRVNGEDRDRTSYLTFGIGAGETVLAIDYRVEPVLLDTSDNLKTLACGSLLFSLPVSYEKKMYEYEENGVKRAFPYCDYEYVGTSAWQFGISDTEFVLEEREIGEYPFSSDAPPVVLKVKVKPIAWGVEEGFEKVAAKVPESTFPIGEETVREFYPYGCAKLRMTELPIV